MPILIGVLVVVLIIVIWYVSTYNGIKALGIKVDEGLSGIDVALTKRYDTLTKLLDVVKGYQKHEKEILLEVIKLRSGMSMTERNAANTQMDQAANQIKLLAEAYPGLMWRSIFRLQDVYIIQTYQHTTLRSLCSLTL